MLFGKYFGEIWETYWCDCQHYVQHPLPHPYRAGLSICGGLQAIGRKSVGSGDNELVIVSAKRVGLSWAAVIRRA